MLDQDERAEIVETIRRLSAELDDLVVRGLRAAGPEDLAVLDAMREEFGRIGAEHMRGRVAALLDAVRADDPSAGAALMRAQASLRLFERVLTTEEAADALAGLLEEDDEADAKEA